MHLVGRLLLRLIVVSLGAAVAIYFGTMASCIANWDRFAALINLPPDSHVIVNTIMGAFMAFILVHVVAIMLAPALIGIAIAETFTIRSWIFHALNGALSSWVGWVTIGRGRELSEFYDNALAILATGLVAGFVYWLIAGWNAGVIKPARAPVPQPPSSATPHQPKI
jgi:hypothetical protein